jgi:hypothetical protein
MSQQIHPLIHIYMKATIWREGPTVSSPPSSSPHTSCGGAGVGIPPRSWPPTTPLHLQIHDQPKCLAHIVPPIMRRNFRAVHEVLDLHDAVCVVTQLALDVVPVRRARVSDVVRLDRGRGVKSVEGDLSTAFPLCHVDLWRPALHGGEPEGRPCLIHV